MLCVLQQLLVVGGASASMPGMPTIWTLAKEPGGGAGEGPLLTAAFLNSTSGELTPAGDVSLPPPASCPSGGWQLPSGTTGQTSTLFQQNATLFFLAQEDCSGGNSRSPAASSGGAVVLFGLMQPFPPFSGAPPSPAPALRVRQYGQPFNGSIADLSLGLEHWNIIWDAVCNVLVLAPKTAGGKTSYITYMLSEFDGQLRPRATYFSQPQAPAAGDLVKVPGLGAVLYTVGGEMGWPNEGNCGDCPVYSVIGATAAPAAAALVAGGGPARRWLVGHNFHSGAEMSKVPDPFGPRTIASLQMRGRIYSVSPRAHSRRDPNC